MQDVDIKESAVRKRTFDVLEVVLGYRPDPNLEELADVDSLQVLELLVLLEEEFDIDTDRIIETDPQWWRSLGGLVTSITALLREAVSEPSSPEEHP